MELKAIGIDYQLKKKISEKSLKGKIIAIFEKAINIKTDDDELISIVEKSKLNGPNFILIENNKNFKDFLQEEVPVEISKNFLKIKENFSINLSECKTWYPNIPTKRIDSQKLKENLSPFLQKLKEKEFIFFKKILENIKLKNYEKVQKLSHKIIGKGFGLTPSGDDILLGFISALQRIKFMNLYPFFDPQLKNTNFISRKFLEYSLHGRLSESVISVIDSYLTGDGLKESIKNILKYGATSGRKILKGIIIGLSLISDDIEKLH